MVRAPTTVKCMWIRFGRHSVKMAMRVALRHISANFSPKRPHLSRPVQISASRLFWRADIPRTLSTASPLSTGNGGSNIPICCPDWHAQCYMLALDLHQHHNWWGLDTVFGCTFQQQRAVFWSLSHGSFLQEWTGIRILSSACWVLQAETRVLAALLKLCRRGLWWGNHCHVALKSMLFPTALFLIFGNVWSWTANEAWNNTDLQLWLGSMDLADNKGQSVMLY